jgi:hypothetical protein
VGQIICAGHSGRDRESVRKHIKELLALGVAAPASTPMFFKVSTYLATIGDRVTVQDGRTSGEVEFVFLLHAGETYLTCGSDHTDRWIERYSVAASKQMYPKVLAPYAWHLDDVHDHWDQLMMRSWATVDGTRTLYQEAPLANILHPGELLDAAGAAFRGTRTDGTVFMSGTLPTLRGGFVYADRFSFELSDPVRNRTIAHAYDVSRLTGGSTPPLAATVGAATQVG